jgi:hypothetical protein
LHILMTFRGILHFHAVVPRGHYVLIPLRIGVSLFESGCLPVKRHGRGSRPRELFHFLACGGRYAGCFGQAISGSEKGLIDYDDM